METLQFEDVISIQDAAWHGGYNVFSETGKHIGHFVEWDDAIEAAKDYRDREGYFSDMVYIDDRGTVKLLDGNGNYAE